MCNGYKWVITWCLLVSTAVLGPLSAVAQEPDRLDNDSIMRMLAWRVPAPELIRVISTSATAPNFQLTAKSIGQLKQQGATDDVIKAMLEIMSKPTAETVPPQRAGSTPANGSMSDALRAGDPQNPPSAPPPPQVPPIPAAAADVSSGPRNSAATPSDDERRRQAQVPIIRARRPAPQQPLSSPMVYQLNFADGTASPDTIFLSGSSILRIVGVNTILYTYRVEVKEIKGTGDDLSQWGALIKSVTDNLIPKTAAATAVGACQLPSLANDANDDLTSLQTQIQKMLPDAPSGGSYKSISFTTSKAAWDQLRTAYDKFENKIVETQTELASTNCDKSPDARDKAEQLILDEFPKMRIYVDQIQKKADAPWQDVPHSLARTSDFTITVTEQFQNASTDAKPVVFSLNHGYSTLTVSGGFLLTKLQARNYTSVAEPFTPPNSSTPSTQNVLGVSGLGSGLRPALVALFNYHDPFDWFLNKPNFGLALSAGPVIEVANGKADTSKFGIFVGGSVHAWARLFITTGVHFGEFSDFPAGYHAPGDVIPANSGTPLGVSRWTGRLAIAITFRGKDLSGLAPNSNNSK